MKQPPLLSAEEPRKRVLHPVLTDFLFPLGGYIVGALGLWAGSERLPGWALWVLVLLLVAIIAIGSAPPFKQFLVFFQKKLKKRRLAKTFYPLLEETAREFAEQMADSRANTMLYLLQHVYTWNELKEYQPALDSVHWMRTLLDSIRKRLTIHRISEFTTVVWDLSIIISQYHFLCVHAAEQLGPKVPSIPEPRLQDFRQQWHIARENYMRFAQSWEQIAKKINAVAEERVCLDYYEPVKPL